MMRDCSRRCVYCAEALEIDVATIDHVFPLAKGGVHVLVASTDRRANVDVHGRLNAAVAAAVTTTDL